MKKSELISIIVIIAVIVGVFFALRATVPLFVVYGSSMEPNLDSGQVLIVNKGAYLFQEPQRGDVIVYCSPEKGHNIIHRIVALPGEKVEIKNGKLYINHELVEESYTQGHSAPYAQRVVPLDHYFIVGDNRGNTMVEMVPRENIIGKAWLSIWPVTDWGLAPNYAG
jgi:signal peptidase I